MALIHKIACMKAVNSRIHPGTTCFNPFGSDLFAFRCAN